MTDANAERRCPVGDLTVEYNPFAEPQLSEPFPVWQRARQQCPVFYSEQLGAWVVTRYDDIVEVLGDYQRFSSVGASRGFSELTPEAQAVLATVPSPSQTDVVPTDPPRHTKMRRFIQLSFLPKRIADLEHRIRTIADELIDTFEPQGHCDFYRDFAYLYTLSVVISLVGMPAGVAMAPGVAIVPDFMEPEFIIDPGFAIESEFIIEPDFMSIMPACFA